MTSFAKRARPVPRAWRPTAAASLLAAAALWMFASPGHAAPQVQTPGFYITTIGPTLEEVRRDPYTPEGDFTGLYRASAIAFADDADVVFAAEKEGLVRVIVDGQLQARPVVSLEDRISIWIDRGLGGIDVHPDFPAVKEILLTYTHDAGVVDTEGPMYAKVAKLALREEIGADGRVQYFADPPTDADVILGKLSATAEFPSCNDRPLGSDCGAVDDGSHSFTFVRYGPDGKIYVGTGDGAGFYSPDPKAFYAQRLEHMAGKVLRINPDGTGPADNPFFTGDPDDNASKVYAYGLRNPKSAAFNAQTGQLCLGNVGWYLTEGIYCLSPGDNAGWPCRENGPVQNGYQTLSLDRDGERLASCPLVPGTYIEPSFAYPHQPLVVGGEELSVGAAIGCATANSDEYPVDFNGTCVYGDYVLDTIASVHIGGSGNPSQVIQVKEAGRPSDVETDRDGNVCWSAYEVGNADGTPVTEIRCLRYDASGAVAQYPVVSFDTSPDAESLLAINLDAADSYHTGGRTLLYRWDFGDGDTAAGESVRHVYAAPGDYTVTLTANAVGSQVRRSTSQVVRLADPDTVTPVLPVVEDIVYANPEHFVSSSVPFGVRVRNDRGTEPFRMLVNIYDEGGSEVAHLVHPELITLAPGATTTVDFLWPTAGGLGEYRMGVEFYATDWSSWTLKYLRASRFVVRTRVSADAEQGGSGTPEEPAVPEVPVVPVTPPVAPPVTPPVETPVAETDPAAPGPADDAPGGPVVRVGGSKGDVFLGAEGAGGPLALLLLVLFRRSAARRGHVVGAGSA